MLALYVEFNVEHELLQVSGVGGGQNVCFCLPALSGLDKSDCSKKLEADIVSGWAVTLFRKLPRSPKAEKMTVRF
jgi:hypothetical protein